MNKSIYVYANGIRCLPSIPSEYKKNKIVFIGNMRTLQNQDAAEFFIYEILPAVKKEIPKTEFHIIGVVPSTYMKKMLCFENVVVSGFVNSVEDEIKNAAVSVAPLRIAAGIQNKVLISMACAVPVVLTSLISAGIPELESSKNCIIADKKNDFASAVVSIMKNENIRNNIGKAGYEMVLSEYSWDKKLQGYEELPA